MIWQTSFFILKNSSHTCMNLCTQSFIIESAGATNSDANILYLLFSHVGYVQHVWWHNLPIFSLCSVRYQLITKAKLGVNKMRIEEQFVYFFLFTQGKGTFIFASKGYKKRERLLVLIHGAGEVRAGQWSRR